MTKMLGLRNITSTKEDWYYLLFYDIDRPINHFELTALEEHLRINEVSYILYKTQQGNHLVGLTPLTSEQWGKLFDDLKELFGGYYSGTTIRLSRKPEEIQQLITINTSNGKVIHNLYNIFAKRFNLPKHAIDKIDYALVFEKYRTFKIKEVIQT